MTTLILIFILLSVGLSVAAQLLLKTGMSQLIINNEVNIFTTDNFIQFITNSYLISGLLAYGTSMVFWLAVLSKTDVSKAYPFVGLGFIGTMLAAHFILGESLTMIKLMGTLLIVTGVVMVASS